MQVQFKLDTREIKAALREEMKHTKRDAVTAINTHLFYIARGAARLTHRASQRKMDEDFGKAMKLEKIKSGKRFSRNAKGKNVFYAPGRDHDAPLLALIVNSRRGKSGKKGLYGMAMENAMRLVYAARVRSIAFIASGFIPGIKFFERLADKKSGAPPMDRQSKIYGQAKGGGMAAHDGQWPVRGIIWNAANAKRDHQGALEKYGAPALDAAFHAEAVNMMNYVRRKREEAAQKMRSSRH